MPKIRSKKGQVTIFIVIGLILIAAFAGVWSLVSLYQTTQLEGEAEKSALLTTVKPRIISFVESCLEQTALPGIYLAGVQGGIIYPEEADADRILLTDNALINYGYLNGVNLLSRERMEKEISRYVEENVGTCLNDFLVFAVEGIIVEEKKELRATALIRSQDVLIEARYKLKIIQGDDSTQVDSFSIIIPLPVGKTLEEAQKIMAHHLQNPSTIDLNSLAQFDYFISAFPFDEFTTVYSLSTTTATATEEAPFTFLFAIREITAETKANTAPQLEYISDVVIREGEKLILEFTAADAENDQLAFSSNSAAFPVSGDGLLEITAPSPGSYGVTITVQDELGLADEQTFLITVIKNEP